MLNPYVMLGLVLFWIASVGAAYYKGGVNKENEVKAEYSRQLESSIKEANDNALIDMQAAREVGEREGRAKARTVYIKGQTQLVFKDNPQPALCNWDSKSFGLLNDAIQATNDLTGAASAVPSVRPAVKPAAKP